MRHHWKGRKFLNPIESDERGPVNARETFRIETALEFRQVSRIKWTAGPACNAR
jgi:hypothetical protein